jgi:PPOX class probable F420-dependent enzyme
MDAAGELDRHRYLSLATYKRNGAEVRTPVWFAAGDGKLFVFSAGDAGKVKRLRNSPRARIAPCDARGGLRGPWHAASARLMTDAPSIEQAHARFRTKYGRQMRLADLFARLLGRLRRRAWIEITLE